jgi:hypothetical protein
MSGLAEYYRFWPYVVALIAGAIFAVIDRRVIGRYVLGALLVLIVAGGQLGMYLSPFTFQGGDYYMTSLIASLLALAGLAGYALAVVGMWARARVGGGATR